MEKIVNISNPKAFKRFQKSIGKLSENVVYNVDESKNGLSSLNESVLDFKPKKDHLTRFKEILNEGIPYRFFEDENKGGNIDANVMTPDPAMAQLDQPEEPKQGNNELPAPDDKGLVPDSPVSEPKPEDNSLPAPDMGGIPDSGNDLPPMDNGMGGDAGTEEIDVTELVTSTTELKDKMVNIDNRFSKVYKDLETINNNTVKVSNDITGFIKDVTNTLQSLTAEVNKMRPPTEDEKLRSTLASSYPFTVTDKDFKNGNAPRTVQDIQGKQVQFEPVKQNSGNPFENMSVEDLNAFVRQFQNINKIRNEITG